jgi:Mlc titration factor MtfA (ptsG expression regulator)
MLFRWLRRRRVLRAPFPAEWVPVLERQPFHALLDPTERATLARIVHVLVVEKQWEGCGGFAMTDEVKVAIAAQAARLILHVEHEYFHNVMSILVYPTAFFAPSERTPWLGPGRLARIGEAAHQGPVVLAWDAVEQANRAPERGHNVVLHEFAHKLDMLDGYVDGTPPLRSSESLRVWATIMGEEYERLVEQQRRGEHTVLDGYGATDHGEFFSVATECFFECPVPLQRDCPTLYDQMRRYYRQDPAARRVAGSVST